VKEMGCFRGAAVTRYVRFAPSRLTVQVAVPRKESEVWRETRKPLSLSPALREESVTAMVYVPVLSAMTGRPSEVVSLGLPFASILA
jgi:hypothetical protein